MAKAKKKRERGAVTSLGSLLEGVSLETLEEAVPKPPERPRRAPKKEPTAPKAPAVQRPSEGLRGDDRIAWYGAIAGVRPLAAPVKREAVLPAASGGPARPPTDAEDEEVRRRLDALVAGAVRFQIEREDEWVSGWRVGSRGDLARALGRVGVVPEKTLDLHGLRADAAAREVVRFVRAQHRRGVTRLCIIHGKGLHSAGGVGVLRDRVLEAITDGGAAPVVRAFATAPAPLGGTGALIVELIGR